MGIDLNSVQLLIQAQKSGVSFRKIATLGRQRLLGDRDVLVSVLRRSGYEVPASLARKLMDPETEYAEDFLRLLGAERICAIDFSDFEGAQMLHDMNYPIPDSLIDSFDLVLDGGTLEHIFDLPNSLRNAAQMVRPNGWFISLTQTNNFCGHGFYQFSPELFYRFFCPKNGYKTEECLIWEDIPRSVFYRVPDPDAVQTRINLTSKYGTYMMVRARRIGHSSRDFVPQQSDYVRLWDEHSGTSGTLKHPGLTVSAKLRSTLKSIPRLRSLVLFARKMLRTKTRRALREYRDLRIERNSRSLLTPLANLRVIR
jgi:SAM-dependent methyltransferase